MSRQARNLVLNAEAYDLRHFANALRDVLDLDPICFRGKRRVQPEVKSDLERFYGARSYGVPVAWPRGLVGRRL